MLSHKLTDEVLTPLYLAHDWAPFNNFHLQTLQDKTKIEEETIVE
jgi:hypothetical protein